MRGFIFKLWIEPTNHIHIFVCLLSLFSLYIHYIWARIALDFDVNFMPKGGRGGGQQKTAPVVLSLVDFVFNRPSAGRVSLKFEFYSVRK